MTIGPAAQTLPCLIQEINEKMNALELKFPEPAVLKYPENQRTIKKPSELASFIDHTLLKPEATKGDIEKLCEEARRFHFRSVCVNPVFVKEARKQLAGTDSSVITVVGFPLGANLTITKVEETNQVVKLGVNEVDMVISLGALKSGDYSNVYDDIRMVVEAAGSIPVKVIIEAGLLEEEEKIAACLLSVRAGASFVKTSTGFSARGATMEDVRLMRAVVGNRAGVKAAGGIRDFLTARTMVEAGATRLGCSASVSIVAGS